MQLQGILHSLKELYRVSLNYVKLLSKENQKNIFCISNMLDLAMNSMMTSCPLSFSTFSVWS